MLKINRRSFLKAVGGLAAVVTLPSNIPTSLPVIPVQTATAQTIAAQELAKQIDEITKPVSTVVQIVEEVLPYTRFPECEIVKPRISIMFNPTVFINGKRLPAHRIACKLDYRHSKWIEYDPDFELTINAEVYGDAAKEPLFDESWRTPIHVKVCLHDGLTYEGKGAVVEHSATLNSFERTCYMIVAMWDVVVTLDTEDRWIVNRNLS